MFVEPYNCPFTILVDTAETQPFTFQGINADADKDFRPLAITTKWLSLGRHPNGLGDYSIAGYSDHVAVERKSVDDCWATVMGWETDHQKERGGTGRRDRFKKELDNLSKLDAAIVVVEGSLASVIADVPEWGDKPAWVNRKIFARSVISMQADYRVPWVFCDSRRLAEVWTFRFFWDFYRKHIK